MATRGVGKLLLAAKSARGKETAASDRDLLKQFAEAGDQTAFAVIVERHAGMVFGACRRILDTRQDAEDACQAVFLVLAKKAGSLRWRESVANWLYATARKVAQNARVATNRRQRREGIAAKPEAVTAADDIGGRELVELLDAALETLTPLYREPLVLCHLEGLTRDEAAARLGVPIATLKSRLERGRARLARALAARGCDLGIALLAAAASQSATAASRDLHRSILAGVDGRPSAMAVSFSQGVAVNNMLTEAKWAVLAVAGLIAVGSALATNPTTAADASKNVSPRLVAGSDNQHLPTSLSGPNSVRRDEPKLEVVVRTGHTGLAWNLALSADGRRVLTSGLMDQTSILWDAQSGHKLRTFRGHACAMSRDGTRVLTGSEDKTATVWNAATGEPIHVLRGHTKEVFCVGLSRDGKWAVTGSEDKTAILWNAETGEKLQTFTGHTGQLFGVCVGADGKSVLTGSFDKTAILWDAETGKKLQTFTGHTERVSVSLSADGKRVLTGSFDKTAILWEAETGKKIRTFTDHTAEIYSVAFTDDGTRALTASGDKATILWDLETGKRIRTFEGIIGTVSGDGDRVLTTTAENSVVLWDAKTGQKLQTFAGCTAWIGSVSFGRDGKRLLIASADKTAVLWDAQTGKKLQTFRGHTGHIWTASLSEDGKQVVTASEDRTAVLWDVQTGRQLLVKGHESRVYSVSLSSDVELNRSAVVCASLPFVVTG